MSQSFAAAIPRRRHPAHQSIPRPRPPAPSAQPSPARPSTQLDAEPPGFVDRRRQWLIGGDRRRSPDASQLRRGHPAYDLRLRFELRVSALPVVAGPGAAWHSLHWLPDAAWRRWLCLAAGSACSIILLRFACFELVVFSFCWYLLQALQVLDDPPFPPANPPTRTHRGPDWR